MNHSDNYSALQTATSHRRKSYRLPAIIVELDLETRAGNSVFAPICPECPPAKSDNSQGLETFASK